MAKKVCLQKAYGRKELTTNSYWRFVFFSFFALMTMKRAITPHNKYNFKKKNLMRRTTTTTTTTTTTSTTTKAIAIAKSLLEHIIQKRATQTKGNIGNIGTMSCLCANV
jgi:hypothetical protein